MCRLSGTHPFVSFAHFKNDAFCTCPLMLQSSPLRNKKVGSVSHAWKVDEEQSKDTRAAACARAPRTEPASGTRDRLWDGRRRQPPPRSAPQTRGRQRLLGTTAHFDNGGGTSAAGFQTEPLGPAPAALGGESPARGWACPAPTDKPPGQRALAPQPSVWASRKPPPTAPSGPSDGPPLGSVFLSENTVGTRARSIHGTNRCSRASQTSRPLPPSLMTKTACSKACI